MNNDNDTIAALSTGQGGAISVIRVSGSNTVAICDAIFRSQSGKRLAQSKGYTLHYGTVVDNERVVDDVLLSLFLAPHSYTGEDSVEISCHASRYIVGRIINLLISNGARAATAGEFTMRAFLSGKIDLSQAEAVADVIAAESQSQLNIARTQMRGTLTKELDRLRGELTELASLIELELDFSTEDVEFADRSLLKQIVEGTDREIVRLIESFSVGNAIKEGVAVAIVGKPNVGKSTLLNTLLGEERAMVSDIAGTTRDSIEEVITIDGVRFRFIDTAGLHATTDRLELMGIERTESAMSKAQIIIQVVEPTDMAIDVVHTEPNRHYICAINKCDTVGFAIDTTTLPHDRQYITISAKTGAGIDDLRKAIRSSIDTRSVDCDLAVVSNSRHYEALRSAHLALRRVADGIAVWRSTDLVAQDVRETLYHIGIITGQITTDEIIGQIFSKFCIGK